MSKNRATLPLTLSPRPQGMAAGRWLYEELRDAILTAKLPASVRLPSSRELAAQYGVARGTVTTVFEQLLSEGYLKSQIGAGTFVIDKLPQDFVRAAPLPQPPSPLKPAGPFDALFSGGKPAPGRPFRAYEPALDAFPAEVWARLSGRRLRRAPRSLFSAGEARGYAPLRDAVAAYLGSSRGVRCTPAQVVIVSGAHQALSLIAGVLLQKNDPVWMEDPGYIGATKIFQAAGAKLIAIPVDENGLDPARGERLSPLAKAVYVTPAHQFPLGVSMPLERRLALLDWAQRTGAYIVEDDYDSEYRYSERPIPALQGLDRTGSVIYMGSFNKVLFTSLRLGYMIVPEPLLERLVQLRLLSDRFTPTMSQAILCDFIEEGHFGRHLRKMRQIYEARLQSFRKEAEAHLSEYLTLPPIQAGLHIPAYLKRPLAAKAIETAALEEGIEAMSLHRFVLERSDINGLLLGFAAFTPEETRKAVISLSKVCRAQGQRLTTAANAETIASH